MKAITTQVTVLIIFAATVILAATAWGIDRGWLSPQVIFAQIGALIVAAITWAIHRLQVQNAYKEGQAEMPPALKDAKVFVSTRPPSASYVDLIEKEAAAVKATTDVKVEVKS